ncbi:MAG: glycoside hydrolase family 2 [Clostridia bacterium]|nr:glycoside hydrolase family 2 [Clostridia bacterium]
MKSISLNGQWKLKGREQEGSEDFISLNAIVPGEVQLDLSEAGYLPIDLFMGKNIFETEKYEGWEWWYERSFIAPDERENVYLVFCGVDCIAEYFLNGEKIGESRNAFIRHEFEIGKKLTDGKNTVAVHILSPMVYAHYRPFDISAIYFSGHIGFNGTATALRKPPHSFGWDIMPRAITSGLWRDVKIEVRDKFYFEQLFFKSDLNGFTVAYELKSKYCDFNNVELEFIGECGESTFCKKLRANWKIGGREYIGIENPQLWWPYGYGEANLYDTTVNIYSDGELVHTEKHKIGLRTVELDRTDHTDGVHGKFRFIVNGVEVMCRGTNWVPLDAFHSRDKSRYEKALSLVKDIGCNILRCWGGNVYEDHEFFDFCDANGIMVWQDFAMACNSYPEDDEFLEDMRREVEFVVREYRNHPSIILWSGDNEIDWCHRNLGRDPDTNVITRKVIPDVINKNDVGRPYIASSPYITGEKFRNNTLDPSEAHLWGARDYYKADFYKQSKAHFVSETGYHGCPSLESIKNFISEDKVFPYFDNDEWNLHSTDVNLNDGRVMLMHKQVRQLFGEVPENAEDYILASQISQAEAKKYFIERIRANRPKTSGIIWWNLLDGWPQMSDAVVDYYFTKKLAYSYIKRSQAPFAIIAGEISSWNLPFFACNDTLKEKSGTVTITDIDTGEIVFESDFISPANSTVKIGAFPVYYSEKRMFVIRWKTSDGEGFNHYTSGNVPLDFETYKKWLRKLNNIYH